MGGLAVRSVQLARETTQAWKDAGVQFARRGRTVQQIIEVAMDGEYDFLLNLGKSEFRVNEGLYSPKFLWNMGEDILPLLYPGKTRQLLGDLMAPQPEEFPAEVWIKAPGMKGKGKYKKNVTHALTLPTEWDWQRHVDGTEYRVITVGPRVVQSFLKTGDQFTRNYEWVGLRDTPLEVKRLARSAAALLPGDNVVGWDMVFATNEQPYIFEGNSCPGVNYATAERIVREIYRQKEEAHA
jgi:hypothetical protein